jgi:hypothetical protein
MIDSLLGAPVAFLIYLMLVGILSGIGRALAGSTKTTALKTSTYAGGEEPPVRSAAPGYAPLFRVAFFFAVLHLGVLMLGSSGLTPIAGVYLVGLILALVALILG